MSKPFFVSTPIYYPNDRPHIGSAYSTLLADVIARQKSKEHFNVHFSTGTDEHGAKNAQTAKAQEKNIQDFVDEYSQYFREAWDNLNIGYSDFIRTTEKRHEESVQYFLEKLHKSGNLYQGVYKGLYCLGCETFLEESELENGLCPQHKKAPEYVEEKNWFFKLSSFREQIKEYITSNKLVIEPVTKKNEVLSLLDTWSSDVSVSREKVTWGIPLPFDSRQTVYVWVDGLINYLTTLGYPRENYKPLWDNSFHIIGKDILKHHAVIWPALLLAIGIKPPKRIFAHSFMTIEGQKMSKSLGNVITPQDLIKEFGIDGARYVLLAEMSPDKDSDLSWQRLRDRYNADLKHNIGNIFSRLIVLAHNNEVKELRMKNEELKIEKYKEAFFENIEAINIPEAVKNAQKIFQDINEYLDKTKPWNETDKEKAQTYIKEAFSAFLEAIDLLEPLIPKTASVVNQTLRRHPVADPKKNQRKGYGGQAKKDGTYAIPEKNIHLFS